MWKASKKKGAKIPKVSAAVRGQAAKKSSRQKAMGESRVTREKKGIKMRVQPSIQPPVFSLPPPASTQKFVAPTRPVVLSKPKLVRTVGVPMKNGKPQQVERPFYSPDVPPLEKQRARGSVDVDEEISLLMAAHDARVDSESAIIETNDYHIGY